MKKSVSMVCHPELPLRHPDESQDLIKKNGDDLYESIIVSSP